MGTVTSSNDEWLELYNPTQNEIDLTGWILTAVDGSPQISLTGKIPAAGYFLLERTDDETVPGIAADQIYTGSLGNTGEWLKLYDKKNDLIDEINNTDGWLGGDNLTKQTLERSATTTWQTSANNGGTPKAQNSTASSGPEETPTEEVPAETPPSALPPSDTETKAKKGEIIITEIFPNPIGVDTEAEFIELKNISQRNINLTDWQIKNAAGQKFIIPSLQMTPQSIVVFYRVQTKLALNNEEEKIKLYSTAGLIINQIEYKTPAPEGESYQNKDGHFSWDQISPGQDAVFENEILPTVIITGSKEAKVGEIITFDGSDSFDPAGRELKFFWQFETDWLTSGVLARYVYSRPGDYQVSLKAVASEKASSTEIFKIKITGEKSDLTQPTTTPTTTPALITPGEIPFIFISEFLPNPEGSDKAEFIEIFSNHDKPVNLAGWQLDDAEGGSKPYIIPEGTVIKPGQYLAFFQTETKITLNNTDDAVRFFAPDGTLVDYTNYEESAEGESFVLDEQFSWQQSNTPTPGEINILDQKSDETKEATSTPRILGAETKEEINPVTAEPKNKNKYIFAGISALAILGIGTILKLKKKKKLIL